MTDATLARAVADAALRAGREIRTLVHAMAPGDRGRATKSILKPSGGYGARHVDAEAEAVGLAHLERLAARLGVGIELLLDAGAASHPIGRRDGARIVASMDVIDGTVKVAGLGAPAPDRVRLANDGGWAAAFAFTLPTRAPLAEIALGDFAVAVVVDGNPTRWPAYPQDVLALPGDAGPSTWEASEDGERRVFTTTSEDLGQLWVSLDTFQAFDRKTRRDGDDALSVALYAALVDRETGGAFDVLRQYANLSALARLLFGWREPPVWVESQGAAFVVVNENLPNLLPAVPLVAGAGGVSVDFDGRPLATRRLGEGRTSVIHAANESIALQLLARVERARSRGPWQ